MGNESRYFEALYHWELGPSDSGGEERLKVVVKITRAKDHRRCLRHVRQVTADTRVMKGLANDQQALYGTTCGVHCRRSRAHLPERAAYLPPSRPAGIAADGDEEKDAASAARVLSRQEKGVLTKGGGVREKQTSTESDDSASFEDLAL